MHYLAIIALIQSLTQQVDALELQLSRLEATQQVSSVPASNPAYQVTPTSTMTQEDNAAPAAKAISVSFKGTDAQGFVTITNDSGVAVRIKSLDVDGELAGITIGSFTYPPSVKDNTGKVFDVFTCDGLGSLGTAQIGGSPSFDPCVRHDSQSARNELEPGEQATLRYVGSPTAVKYQPGSIVEVATGNDVQF